jgi:predicted transcriptional regulator
MTKPKLSKLALKVLEVLWTKGDVSIREIQQAFPEKTRPAYTTIQTVVYRLEKKKAVRRVGKMGNFHLFAADVTREAAQRNVIDELLGIFGGSPQPVMMHLIQAGKMTLADVNEVEKTLRKLQRKKRPQ